ncbi:MAG: hypothetical protein K6A28_02755 [Bacteroidales bacterium]|nr:hypothetical protein [Bacteroidales bacterium]
MKRVLFTLILSFAAIVASAQTDLKLRCNLEGDYTRTARFQPYGSVAADLTTSHDIGFTLGYRLGGKHHAVTLAYQIPLYQSPSEKHQFYLENRYLYRYFNAYNLQEFNGILSFGYRNTHWNFRLGLCNRYIAEIPLRINGGEGVIFEPMNIVFSIEGNLFTTDHPWNIGAGISNYREFHIERFTLFNYNIHGYYNIDEHWRVNGEAGLHPAGILNLSAQYNGFYINLGGTYHF